VKTAVFPNIPLTPQQQAVVAHNHGPALVFAVAGAGKTTAMVHRIERLVRENIFPAQQILATSFGKKNELDLTAALAQWPHCRAVPTRTLHALGRSILVSAQKQGYWPHLRLNHNDAQEQTARRLLGKTLALAWQQKVPYARELDSLDRDDFLTYVGFCKGNLLFADLEDGDLPPTIQAKAQLAPAPDAPLGWYRELYRLYEQVRRQDGIVTFDDMLLSGWVALVTFPDVLTAVQQQYQCVLVDEFQDINLVQSEILDLLTQPHRNYMAIGDDDQTIYEWRSANPRFILDFAQRYVAQTYHISDNFRCPAAPLVLANQVIRHNQNRQPKQLRLTKGFAGQTKVQINRDLAQMSEQIVAAIQAQHRAGMPYGEMAVLVRLNAQTPPIEQALITHKIPYVASQPFYDRREIKTLIDYGRLAWYEAHRQRDNSPSERIRQSAREAWEAVCNRPKRYIPRDVREQISRAIIRQDKPISQLLQEASASTTQEWLPDKLQTLAKDIAWLAGSLEQNAGSVLDQLEKRLGYCQFLHESSGFPQTGAGYAASVQAFIQYAQDKGSLTTFLAHIRSLSKSQIGKSGNGQRDAVTLSTIHQAKGLEWSLVCVPQCNQGTLPFLADKVADNLEEERRLFYVALTRAKQDLHLYTLGNEPISQFLAESNWRAALQRVQRAHTLLAADPARWQAADARDLIMHVSDLGLASYFTDWWNAEPERKTAVAHTLQQFFIAAETNRALHRLGINPDQITPWQQIAPLPPGIISDGFPGLKALLPPEKSRPHPRDEAQESRYPLRHQAAHSGNPLLTNTSADPHSFANRLRRVQELARQKDDAAIPSLISALDDSASSIRYLARSALANMGGTAVDKALRAYLSGNPKPEGAQEAQQALDYLSSPQG
jgi:DNA helicase-2/ATP-dependent DNA helicase PcrA